MRNGYYDAAKGVTIDLVFGKPDDKIAIITRVEVHRSFRGLGYASEIMQRVLEDADEEGMGLLLAVEPDGTGLTSIQLRAWYERMGFQPMSRLRDEADTAMIRLPRGLDVDIETFTLPFFGEQ